MRIKIQGNIVEKTNLDKWHYTHGTYAMILNHLSPDTASAFHGDNKKFRLLTFSDIFFTPRFSDKGKVHFYVAGEDSIIQEFIESVCKSLLVRIEDMVIGVSKIDQLPALVEKSKYLFQSRIIINIPKEGQVRLLDDIPTVEKRLRENAIKKAKVLGKQGDITFKLIHPVRNVEQYKKGHIFSWKCKLEVSGDYDIVNTIYEVGCGENTASGHGFLFELSRGE